MVCVFVFDFLLGFFCAFAGSCWKNVSPLANSVPPSEIPFSIPSIQYAIFDHFSHPLQVDGTARRIFLISTSASSVCWRIVWASEELGISRRGDLYRHFFFHNLHNFPQFPHFFLFLQFFRTKWVSANLWKFVPQGNPGAFYWLFCCKFATKNNQ